MVLFPQFYRTRICLTAAEVGLQETEGDADIAEAVRLAVVLFKIVAGKLAAPDKIVIAAERQIDLETV